MRHIFQFHYNGKTYVTYKCILCRKKLFILIKIRDEKGNNLDPYSLGCDQYGKNATDLLVKQKLTGVLSAVDLLRILRYDMALEFVQLLDDISKERRRDINWSLM